MFAEASIRDLADGLDGWIEANGGKKAGASGRMTRKRMEELKAQYAD